MQGLKSCRTCDFRNTAGSLFRYLLAATGTTSRPVAPSAQLFGATRDPIKLSKLHRRWLKYERNNQSE